MRRILAGVLFVAALSAHAASFDCTKAKTRVELAICANPQLSKADDEMAVAYKKALAELPPDFAAQLHDDQRTWLQMRAVVCSAQADAFDKNEQQNGLRDCLINKYSDRTTILNAIHQQKNGIVFIQQTKTLFSPDDQPDIDENFRKSFPYGTLAANWPVAMSAAPEWQSWNKAIRSALFQVLNISEADAKLTDWPAKWNGWSDVDLSADLESVNQQYVTSTVENFWYGHGAAHPNRNWLQLNWLLKEQREMRAEDVFKKDSAWERTLLDMCMKDLKLKVGEENMTMPDADGYKKTVDQYITNPQNWTLKKEGLTIEWQPYAVACYACTPDATTIPWKDLKEYLNPSFRLPE